MRSFSEHCAYLGFPLRNVRWSWCAVSADRQRALFTVWTDEVKGRRFVLYPVAVRRPGPVGAAADLKAGGREVQDVANLVADGVCREAFGVLCTAADPDAIPRVRKRFAERDVFRLAVFREGEAIVAELAERIPVERLRSETTRASSASLEP